MSGSGVLIGGAAVRGLPYSTDYKLKPAWHAIAAALDAAPARTPE